MVHRQLRDGLEAGDLRCRDSACFRSFDDDLIDDATFDRRAELLPRYGLEVAARPIREQIEELRDLVEARFESVNRRVLSGENAFVRVQEGRTVRERATHGEEPPPSEPFFDMVERLDTDTRLLFVDQRNGLMEAFESHDRIRWMTPERREAWKAAHRCRKWDCQARRGGRPIPAAHPRPGEGRRAARGDTRQRRDSGDRQPAGRATGNRLKRARIKVIHQD